MIINRITEGGGNNRQSNIELLRIFCILSVITHHFCNAYPNALELSNGVSYLALRFTYSLGIVAVNTFFIITGYFSIDKFKIKLSKVFDLYFEVVFYHLFPFAISSIVRHSFSLRHLVVSFIPTGYFIIIYLSIYVLSPYINKAVENITKKQYLSLMVIMTFLFSFWNSGFNFINSFFDKSLTDCFTVAQFTTDRGYNIVTFVTMYLWGGYIRKNGLFKNSKSLTSLIICICVIITATGILMLPRMNSLYYYDSIFVVIQSLATFVFFNQLSIKSIFINFLAKFTFGVYLSHIYVLKFITQIPIVSAYLSGSLLRAIFIFIVSLLFTYFITIVVDICRSSLFNRLSKLYSENIIYNRVLNIE